MENTTILLALQLFSIAEFLLRLVVLFFAFTIPLLVVLTLKWSLLYWRPRNKIVRCYLAHPKLTSVLIDIFLVLVAAIFNFFVIGYINYVVLISVLMPDAPPLVGMAMAAGLTPLILAGYLTRSRTEELENIRWRYESASKKS